MYVLKANLSTMTNIWTYKRIGEDILRNSSVLKAIVKHGAQLLIYRHPLIQEIVGKYLCVTGTEPGTGITRVMVPFLAEPLRV